MSKRLKYQDGETLHTVIRESEYQSGVLVFESAVDTYNNLTMNLKSQQNVKRHMESSKNPWLDECARIEEKN